MDSDRNVVCIKWGDKFSADYVNKLYNMVQRNLSLKHRFICLTEDPTDLNPNIEVFPLTRNDLEYCWNKLVLFEKKLYNINGTILFFDLDVVIINPIDDLFLFQPKSEFASVKDWGFPDRCLNASIMRMNGNFDYIIEEFYRLRASGQLMESREYDDYLGSFDKVTYVLPDIPPLIFYGDQEWTTYQLTHRKAKITWYPENWLKSYKFGYDMSAKIVVFHGSPKPHEVEDSWVKLHWK
jgi:hypothetical protein